MKIPFIFALVTILATATFPTAHADEDAKIKATIGRLGKTCKDKLMMKYAGVPMAQLNVSLSASLQESLDSGAMGLKDLKQYGATFNWEVPPKNAKGTCDVNGKGKITQFSVN